MTNQIVFARCPHRHASQVSRRVSEESHSSPTFVIRNFEIKKGRQVGQVPGDPFKHPNCSGLCL